ncbi:SDR family NAD(P)-dependent oxidoreductase [Streptomyces bauhiniae]
MTTRHGQTRRSTFRQRPWYVSSQGFQSGTKDALDRAVESIGSAVTAVPGDISEPADLDRLYDAIRGRGRGLDVLFANAGMATLAPLAQATQEQFDQIFDVNVRGTLLTVQKALPLLNDGAAVIFNDSIRADDGREGFGLYAASKAAIRSLARTWANELKGRGIRVNTVAPGAIDTPGVDIAIARTSSDSWEVNSHVIVGYPLRQRPRREGPAPPPVFVIRHCRAIGPRRAGSRTAWPRRRFRRGRCRPPARPSNCRAG